jgi:hypothetical protein
MKQSAALLLCVSAMLVGKALAGDDDTYDGDEWYPAPCYSAWAKGGLNNGMCVEDGYPNPLSKKSWGWTNKISTADGTTVLTLYANASGCDASQGENVGNVTVVVAGGTATFTYAVSSSVNFELYHLYMGRSKWHYIKKPTTDVASANPGKFPEQGEFNGAGAVTVSVSVPAECTDHFYVMAHAKVCEPETPCPPTPAPTPVPTPAPTLAPQKVPEITINPTKAQVAFTIPPTAGPSCPIVMTGANGPVPSESFLNGCGCSEFLCDSPTSPWEDKNYRFCGKCPAYLNGAYHFSCPHCAAAGTEVSFDCPNEWEVCDVFVQVYSNCATGDTDGGLAYNLASEGWTPGSCGPNFCLNFNDTCQSPPTNAVVQPQDTDIQWKMVMFHKQFPATEPATIPALATNPTMYFTFFVKEGHACSNTKTSQADCEASPSVCKWNEATSECVAEICPPVGPPPGARACCDVAPGVETGDCAAEDTAITSVCDFNLPQCASSQQEK